VSGLIFLNGIGNDIDAFSVNSSSQIDYILVQDPSLVNEYIIDQKSGINLSAHTTVRMRTTIGAPFYVKKTSLEQNPGKSGKV
jgi:hypothetical protein